jgi:hypothetical protein
MTNPDALVRAGGQDVDLHRLTDPVLVNNELDADASTFELITIPAIVSDLTYKDERRLEGRVDNASLKITVESDVDIRASDRPIRPDKVRHPAGAGGKIYEVAEVRTIAHPLADIEKKTAVLSVKPGRTSLE